MFIVFGRGISLVLWTREISISKKNSHNLHRVITHSLVLVIILGPLAHMEIVNTRITFYFRQTDAEKIFLVSIKYFLAKY